jgi:hypothetical protein
MPVIIQYCQKKDGTPASKAEARKSEPKFPYAASKVRVITRPISIFAAGAALAIPISPCRPVSPARQALSRSKTKADEAVTTCAVAALA